jgi:hypothetical protein
MMKRLLTVAYCTGMGAVIAPVIGFSFVENESDTPGWAGFKASLAADGRMLVALAIFGAGIGVLYGIYSALKGRTVADF